MEDLSTTDKIIYIKNVLYEVENILEGAYKLLKYDSDRLTPEQRKRLEADIDKMYIVYKDYAEKYLSKKVSS